MISKEHRFHGHNAVSRVKGSSVHTENFSLRCAKSRRADYRLAVVVSKKVDNRAVVRNKIRRRVFEVFRTQKRLQGLAIDVVVYVKTAKPYDMGAAELSDEISSLTKKCLAKVS